MQEKEIVRKQNYINRIEVFKERTDEFFANYENLSGGDECLEVCLIRDGCRAVSQAEKTINRLQAENENYSKNNQQMTSDILKLYKELEQAKAENERLKNAYKQVAWERDCFETDNKRLYEIIENKNIKMEEQ